MKRLPQVSLISEIMPPKVREFITYDVSVDILLNSNRFSAYEANFSQFFLKESICLLSDIHFEGSAGDGALSQKRTIL